ncbi:hypothetical protein NQ314_003867 [Rhamnusium bicolor]|uniref:Uncharacterized protein n=1 Tax=Rhamnusium bicolor TaxID=1586634 RepID=A0AAV8ZN47_9CUCU|nr:hypothetical protein NQ314_003867 [Rhamnusium bicolor]
MFEQFSKRNQLRVFGVPESNNGNLKEIFQGIFENKMEVNGSQLEYCYRLGPYNKGDKYPRPILATFIDAQQRNLIFNNKKETQR